MTQSALTFDPNLSHFTALDLPEKLIIDPQQLQTVFYQKSKQYHPDRFMKASLSIKENSQLRSTQINEAYQVLKDFFKTIEYLLKIKKIPESDQKNIPLELSEAFFEVQELMTEQPQDLSVKNRLKNDLTHRLKENEKQLKDLAAQWDQSQEPEILKKIRQVYDQRKYILAMEKNLEKI